MQEGERHSRATVVRRRASQSFSPTSESAASYSLVRPPTEEENLCPTPRIKRIKAGKDNIHRLASTGNQLYNTKDVDGAGEVWQSAGKWDKEVVSQLSERSKYGQSSDLVRMCLQIP